MTVKASVAAEKGKDLYGKAKEAFAKGADEAQRYVQEVSGKEATSPSASSVGVNASSYGNGSPDGGHSVGNSPFNPNASAGPRQS